MGLQPENDLLFGSSLPSGKLRQEGINDLKERGMYIKIKIYFLYKTVVLIYSYMQH